MNCSQMFQVTASNRCVTASKVALSILNQLGEVGEFEAVSADRTRSEAVVRFPAPLPTRKTEAMEAVKTASFTASNSAAAEDRKRALYSNIAPASAS